ncbi:hypothetical protein [Mycoplasmopsis cynos]|uniref:Uncharacterized protein n=1 Tax=Mycoplasmopsis cynos TaxID=171284 RepID=A0ABD8AJ48_9BACT|nr:hypothetical protein [Mycoplasmopsis cynos]MCU9935192.1 hypothetical protein [Mycoplasmopsis cynos]UWV80607.1 hypothetical protein NW069_04915 [Mycoplasmopsis cynos]WAM05299.1 hypothetical protein OM999_02725 [Mycoplasmopsis cynos]WAM08646.1 hypothetical protein ONA03_03900 [Mycoplasmopsis cynos]WQQ19955.1 hypothetical protein RRG46_00125 [Mycoplasmopsis cynos]
MEISRSAFLVIFLFILFFIWSTYITLFKLRIWHLNRDIYVTNKKTMIFYLGFYLISLILSIIIVVLVLKGLIYTIEYTFDEKGNRIAKDNEVINVYTSIDFLLPALYLLTSLIPFCLVLYYLLNSKVSEYIKPDEVLIFYDNYSFNIDEVAKSYYVLKPSKTKKGNQVEKTVVYESYISSSLIFFKLSKKLFYKNIIKKTVSFVLYSPYAIPNGLFEKNHKNLICMYLIASISILNKLLVQKITLEELLKNLKGLTY